MQAGPHHRNTHSKDIWCLQVIHLVPCNTERRFPENCNQNTGKEIKILHKKPTSKGAESLPKPSMAKTTGVSILFFFPFSTECFSLLFPPKQSGTCSLRHGSAADGNPPRWPSSGLLAPARPRHPPTTGDCLSSPHTSAAKEHAPLLIPLVFPAVPTWSMPSVEQLA